MVTGDYIRTAILPAAMGLLPEKLNTREARAILMAIGAQESREYQHRRQVGGPARGFWQFEEGGGIKGVIEHHASRPLLLPVLQTLRYSPSECAVAIVHNDVLACVFARLLLFTHPKPLPAGGDVEGNWNYYLATWRPGKPHRVPWTARYEEAWAKEAA